jgi:tetratricopeptide (TPR) repeat protein/ADP-heptose:LPS heptosyltransferase
MNIEKAIKSAFEYHKSGKLEEAENLCRKILRRQPKNFDILNLFGVIHYQKQEYDSAINYLEKAISINQSNAQVQHNLGLALFNKSQIDEAIPCFKRAVQLDPLFSDAWLNLGNAFFHKGSFDEAIEYYHKALQSNPNHAEASSNLATCLIEKGQYRQSIDYFKKAILSNPNYARAHFNLSCVLLLLGDFHNGWKEYFWRWGLEEFSIPDFKQPLWDGSEFSGKTLFIHTEQGFGDMIQIVRYIPLVASRGGKIIIQCQKALLQLVKNVAGVEQVIGEDEPLPDFDLHFPLLCLPMIFNANLENIPAEVPYIRADALLVKHWKEKMQADTSSVKVGLIWQGNPVHKRDCGRSIAFEKFTSLQRIGNVSFYSLQKGPGSEHAKNPLSGMKLIDFMDEVHDFSDTAALIDNLDLVISVDTSVAHLAGAMGKPVWTLIQSAPDWRWMLDREDSPWYPTMRLFRQPQAGDWDSVIMMVERELRKLCKGNQQLTDQEPKSTEESVEVSSSVAAADGVQEDSKEKNISHVQKEDIAIILNCEGMGDCLFAIPVIKKIYSMSGHNSRLVIFTHHQNLFAKCPYLDAAFSIHDTAEREKYKKVIVLFDTSKLAHWTVDTFDFISIPIGIGGLSFREKQLEYFPIEEDKAQHFDVVINTSVTWPSRSWPIEHWQKVADFISSQGHSIAVVGKDTYSKADNMWKKSLGLKGCADLTNKLSLDQTYYTIQKCNLFITCQNGLSVLSGATDTEIIVLDMSIEWSKRAIYRHEDPHYKVSYVKGNCMIYCCSSFDCGIYGEFRCIPTVEQVLEVVKRKIALSISNTIKS